MPRITVGNLPLPIKPIKEYQPEVTDVAYKHSIVNAKRQPLGALLTHIEGSSWTVDYYSQVLGADEENAPYDFNQSGTYQQYLYIKNYELKLQGQLNTTVDPTDQTMTITGTAILYPYMRPNFGDAFIADMGDGKAGLFTITEVEQKSFFKQACFEIQFVLARYVDLEIDKNIKSKVIKSTEFVKDFMSYGQNPIIATSDKMKYDNLTNLLDDTLNDWLSEYFSNEYRTLIVPNSTTPTYDPFLTKMIATVFDGSKYPLVKELDLLNVDDNNLTYYGDIWTALINREMYMIRNCFCEYLLIPSKSLDRNPFLQTAYWAGLKSILVPKPEGNLVDERMGLTKAVTGGVLTGVNVDNPAFTLPNLAMTNNYVFSHDFYHNLNDSTTMSDIEYMVRDYFNMKALNWNKLADAIESRHTWTHLQRFYMVPVLLLLLISEIRNT